MHLSHLLHLLRLWGRGTGRLVGVVVWTEDVGVGTSVFTAVFLPLEIDEHLLALTKRTHLSNEDLALALAIRLFGEELNSVTMA